jgi:hypothetical protein
MSNFDEKVVDRIKRLEREVERLRVKESPGAWLNWTPTISWSGGTTNPGTVTINSARYCKIGKALMFNLQFTTSVSAGDRTGITITIPANIATHGSGSCIQTLTAATNTWAGVLLSYSADRIIVNLPSAIDRLGYVIISGTYEVE